MQLASQGDAADLRAELRGRALSSLYYFTKVVMDFQDLVPHYHLPKCGEIQNSIWMRKRGFLWPRKTFKSTILKSYVVWRLCGGGYAKVDYSGKDPKLDPRNKRWLFVGESEGRVVDAVKNIKWHILNNQMLRWLFPEIIPPTTNGIKWRDDEIELPRSRSYDEGTIRAVGIDKKFTGYHGDGFFFDDVIGLTAAESPTVMQRAWDWINVVPGFINDQNDFEYVFAGTRWKFGDADIYGQFMAEQPFDGSDPDNPTGVQFYVHSALDENGEPTFPERLSKIQLAQLEKDMKPYVFSCQFMNEPAMAEGADFQPAQLKQYDITQDEEGRWNTIVPTDGTPSVKLGQLARISFYDPSSGGKSAGCENAIATLGTAADGRHFVLNLWLKNCGYRAAIEQWHVLNDQFCCSRNMYEDVGAQKEIEEFIIDRKLYRACTMCGKVHRKLIPLPIKPLHGREKDDRIRLYLQPTVEEGRLYLHRTRGLVARTQILQFPHGRLKDGIDAIAYCVHESQRPSTETELQDAVEMYNAATAPKTQRVATTRQYGGYA
jgi:hypothetical protein